MNLRYIVELTEHQRRVLEELTQPGKLAAPQVKRAHILLMTDGHPDNDAEVHDALATRVSTVARTR